MKKVDLAINIAAESHVDNSFTNPISFSLTNTIGAHTFLLNCINNKVKKIVHISSDEVYGEKLIGSCDETQKIEPTNPYSASKSAAEKICQSYENTYNIPLKIVNVMNVFGETQYVEKFIPNTIKKILNDEKVLIHSYPDKIRSGTRFYIHARNVSDAVLFIIKNGKLGETYHISGEREVNNLKMAEIIAKVIGKKLNYEMIDFHSSRPGHDLRYGLDDTKLKSLGWKPPVNFENSLKKTIEWTLKNKEWLEY